MWPLVPVLRPRVVAGRLRCGLRGDPGGGRWARGRDGVRDTSEFLCMTRSISFRFDSGLQPSYERGNDAPVLVFGIIASIMISAGLLYVRPSNRNRLYLTVTL